MRFGRLQCDSEGAPLGIEDLAESGQLDFLQLDYPRPRWTSVEGTAPAEIPEYAVGFGVALRAIVKALYLDPQLHVIASAGWASAFSCVERAAAVLVEAGCGEMPLAAVRGSNLQPILEMLEGDGINLDNHETGAPWRELKAPVLAADLQLGAGPLALALAEHARVIVAGAFDGSAPLTAASAQRFGWKWDQHDLLAAAAAAARAATWIDWEAFSVAEAGEIAWRPNRVEINEAGEILVEPARADGAAATRLQQWLREAEPLTNANRHADVRERCSTLKCGVAGPGQLAISGAQGAASDDCWELEVLYEAGFAVEALIEFSAASDRRWRQHLATMARTSLRSDGAGLLTVEELQGTAGGWLHLAFQSKSRGECQQFAEQVVKLAAAHRPHMRLSSGRPAVHVHCDRWPVRVPRDAVDIAVETRVAREWV
ncbi:MAG: hypothetical protein C0485_02035 [Pirellula sp.]|nr:hypothetical protein [Pirellula sp.]